MSGLSHFLRTLPSDTVHFMFRFDPFFFGPTLIQFPNFLKDTWKNHLIGVRIYYFSACLILLSSTKETRTNYVFSPQAVNNKWLQIKLRICSILLFFFSVDSTPVHLTS